MSPRGARALLVSIVALHLTLVLAYTLPRALVPDRMFHWSQHYVRPLFHQRWNMFAPDPSICDHGLEVGMPDGTWRALIPADRPYLVRRMARPLAQRVHDDLLAGGRLEPFLQQAIHGLARDLGRGTEPLRFRVMERCVMDPKHPGHRTVDVLPVPPTAR